MTYSTDEPRWVALKLKLGFVLAMKDIFVRPQLLEASVCAQYLHFNTIKFEFFAGFCNLINRNIFCPSNCNKFCFTFRVYP